EFFIGEEGRTENKEERPAHAKAAAPKVEDQEGAEQTSEKELKNVDKPKVGCGRVRGIGRAIFCAIDEQDAPAHDSEVHDDPEIVPKCINAFKCYGVEGEAAQ